jgi:hypothetical protein
MKLKLLTQTELFANLPDSFRDNIIKSMTSELLLTKYNVNRDRLKDNLSVIQRRYKYPSKVRVIESVESGEVIPVFDSASVIPTSIPAWLVYDKSKNIVAIANLSPYAKEGKVDLEIDIKKLFGCIQAGLVVLGLYTSENKVINNANILKNATYIYTRMFARCLDRIYSLNLDPLQTDRVSYQIAKFFQIHLMSRENNATTKNLAMTTIPGQTPKASLERMDEEYVLDYSSLTKFVESLSSSSPALSNLTIRSFMEVWIKMFGSSALFAVESGIYFFVAVMSAASLSGMNTELIINNLADKQVQALYSEFFRLVR